MTADASAVLKLPRGVRLQFNAARQQWFLLGPERVFEPDDISVEILQRIDGRRSLGEISRDLASAFQAPVTEIEHDVAEFVTHLLSIRMLEESMTTP